MRAFIDRDFLLDTPWAKTLYHEGAAPCPIIDYHCHLNPKEIYEDLRYDNLAQLWLGADHYKWRLMRCAGVSEDYITGQKPAYEKFTKWAEVLGKAIGNPLYHWSHLELRRYFDYEGLLNAQTADRVWAMANEKLKSPEFSVRKLIERSGVETLCTTDDPADDLFWHQKLAKDPSFLTAVLPAWRPDKAMSLEKPAYLDYLKSLEEASGLKITSFEKLKAALDLRMDFFMQNGCSLSDHGLTRMVFEMASPEEIESIFKSRLEGRLPSPPERDRFHTAFLIYSAKACKKRGFAMQLHYGCLRDNNPRSFKALGPDTGFDAINDQSQIGALASFMGHMAQTGELPRTLLYSLNPNDNAALDVLSGCFQNDEAQSKIQHGSAWWFNDHLDGMTAQLKSLAASGYLAGFVGMLTDSRSFLSYSRHEYFRRILCRILGQMVEEGLYPEDRESLLKIVRGISYENARDYFRFPPKQG